MHIHNYQIHNVLNVYQRQLTQGVANNKQKTTSKNNLTYQINYKSSRQTIMDKVASNVLGKINLLDTESQSETKLDDVIQRELQDKKNSEKNKSSQEFSYNVIDQNNQKISSSISVKNSEELINGSNMLSSSKKVRDQYVAANTISTLGKKIQNSSIDIKL